MPEFGFHTTAPEIVATFPEKVEGKTCKSHYLLLNYMEGRSKPTIYFREIF